MRLKNKKADDMLLNHVLTWVIAVFCILILLYALYLLYSNYTENKEQKKAIAVLNDIVDMINKAKEGESASKLIFNSDGWYITYYNLGTTPYSCNGERCLCICKSKNAGNIDDANYFYKKQGLEECDKQGACKILGEFVEIDNKQQKIYYPGVEVSVGWLYIEKLPFEINVTKQSEKIVLRENK